LRIDKYIWAIRIFKTRAIATKACKDGKVLLNHKSVRASKNININDKISVKEIPIWRTFSVIQIPISRIGAKLLDNYVEETTSNKELLLLNQHKLTLKLNKTLGFKGRPTKKERRNLDKLSF